MRHAPTPERPHPPAKAEGAFLHHVEELRDRIARRAAEIRKRSGRPPEEDLESWLEAEIEILGEDIIAS